LKELQSKFNKVILLLDRVPQHCHSIKVRKYLEKNKVHIIVIVFKIVFTMSNTSIKYLIQAIIIIISFTIPLTLDSSSLLTTTTTTTALAFHVDSAGNPTIHQGDVGTGEGTTAAAGGGGGGANTTVATVVLNYINETRKAIQVGNSTAALANLDLAERQLSLLIGGIFNVIGGGGVPAPISIPAEEGPQLQEQPLLGETNISPPENQTAATPSLAAIGVEESSYESCNDNADNDHDGQIDEGCALVPPGLLNRIIPSLR
jgi:hypothetical protein